MIKVARSSQSKQECVDNVLAAISTAVDKVPRKWEGVQVRPRRGLGAQVNSAVANRLRASGHLPLRPDLPTSCRRCS